MTVLLAIGACGSPASTPTPPAPTQAVVDCGTYSRGQGEALPASALSCFADAVQAGRSARLRQTRLTTEGDPIAHSYTADAAGRVTVITDLRQDRFGPGGIQSETCEGPDVTKGELMFSTCSEPSPLPSAP